MIKYVFKLLDTRSIHKTLGKTNIFTLEEFTMEKHFAFLFFLQNSKFSISRWPFRQGIISELFKLQIYNSLVK